MLTARWMNIAARVLVLALILGAACTALGAWEENGNEVCVAEDEQHDATISGSQISYSRDRGPGRRSFGSIVAWADDRYWGVWESDVCAQMLSEDGDPLWDPAGVAICDAPGQQSYPLAVPDGTGGAVIVWRDRRGGGPGYALYAQRVNEYGDIAWSYQGVEICSDARNPSDACVTADLSGGVIVAWLGDSDSGGYREIQAQRIAGDMSEPWSTEHIVVFSDSTVNALFPDITYDGEGGAIVTWECDGPEAGVHAQRVDSSGAVTWTSGSTRLCNGNGYDAEVISDELGGAIVAWEDYRVPEPLLVPDIYAQRVRANGDAVWPAGGIPVCSFFERQDNPVLTTDGAAGAIICWEDVRTGDDEDLYAARVDSGGSVLWLFEGEPICVAPQDQEDARIIPDDLGGAIIVWRDWRGVAPFYAQRVDADGIPYWLADGAPVCVAPVSGLPEITTDGASGAVVTWSDGRYAFETAHDIFAKRLPADYNEGMGIQGGAVAKLGLEQNSPNPFNPLTTIRGRLAAAGHVTLDVVDVSGRAVARVVDGTLPAGTFRTEWRGEDDEGRPLPSGVYFCRLRSGGGEATVKMVLLR